MLYKKRTHAHVLIHRKQKYANLNNNCIEKYFMNFLSYILYIPLLLKPHREIKKKIL